MWRSHWNQRHALGGRRLTYAILVAMTFFAALPYGAVNRLAYYRDLVAFDPTIQLDLDMPFIAWMIVPYLTLYFYYPAAAWLGSVNDTMWRQNVIFHQMMLITCWWVCVVFVLLPVEIVLRHLIVGIEGTAWEPWYEFLHGADKPWNSWPSLHIVQSTQVVLILRYWYPPSTQRMKLIHGFLLIMWFLLVLSTMTIKQHYIWDVATALLLTGLAWKYWMKPNLEALETEEAQNVFDTLMQQD